ncbi:MAG TPA: hypothetical protein VD837_07500 [Terriglobales bacterium]|nr:hypothetical protein [Terriglobales bacterium]
MKQAAEPESVRVVGYLTLVVATAFLILYAANIRAHFSYGAASMPWLAAAGLYAVAVGWGLLRLRKWAAVMLALPLCIYGLLLGTLSIAKNHSFANIILALGWAALLCSPTAMTARAWRALK